MPDERDVLEQEYGELAGYEPRQAVKLMTGYHSQLAEQNRANRERIEELEARLKEKETPPPPKPKVNLETLKGDDQEAAAKALEDYTRQTAETVVNETLGRQRQDRFPRDRAEAIREAREQFNAAGGNFDKYQKALEQYMSKADPAIQTNPMSWVQAATLMEGTESMKARAQQGNREGRPFVETPTRRSPAEGGGDGKYFEDPAERKELEEWDRVTGQKTSPAEWQEMRDNIHNVDEYEAFVLRNAEKAKGGRRG